MLAATSISLRYGVVKRDKSNDITSWKAIVNESENRNLAKLSKFVIIDDYWYEGRLLVNSAICVQE